VRSSFRYSVCAIATMLVVVPVLGAQQRADNLRRAAAVTDSASATANATALFPLSVPDVAPVSSEPDRYRILAHRIDSISAFASRLAGPAVLRGEIAQTASRLVLFSQLGHGFGVGGSPATFASAHSPYGSMDWINFVTLAGVTGLARNSFLAPDESDETVLGSLRGAGQWAGMAAAAGGASWLISNLTRRSMCLSRLSCRRPTTEHQNR
jgi:hypothetical protein